MSVRRLIMIDVIEDVRNEFKVKLIDKFEEEVISFLNTNGGNILLVLMIEATLLA